MGHAERRIRSTLVQDFLQRSFQNFWLWRKPVTGPDLLLQICRRLSLEELGTTELGTTANANVRCRMALCLQSGCWLFPSPQKVGTHVQRVVELHFAITRLVTKSYGTTFTRSKALSRRRTEIGTGSSKPMGQVMIEPCGSKTQSAK